jgi:hypothetical protein
MPIMYIPFILTCVSHTLWQHISQLIWQCASHSLWESALHSLWESPSHSLWESAFAFIMTATAFACRTMPRTKIRVLSVAILQICYTYHYSYHEMKEIPVIKEMAPQLWFYMWHVSSAVILHVTRVVSCDSTCDTCRQLRFYMCSSEHTCCFPLSLRRHCDMARKITSGCTALV